MYAIYILNKKKKTTKKVYEFKNYKYVYIYLHEVIIYTSKRFVV